MESLLYRIYSGEYEATPEQDGKQRELHQRLCAEWDRIQDALGAEFVNHLLELEGERDSRQNFLFYRAGFRAGVRLLLEGLTSATG